MNFPPRAGRVSGRATPSLRHAPRAELQRTNPGSSPLGLRGILFRGSGLALSAASYPNSLTMTCAQVQGYIRKHGQTLLTTGKESGNYSFDYTDCGGTVPG